MLTSEGRYEQIGCREREPLKAGLLGRINYVGHGITHENLSLAPQKKHFRGYA